MAVCGALAKLKTAILDIDPQHSAYGWNESHPNGRKLDAVAAEAGQLAARLRQAEDAGVDLAIEARGALARQAARVLAPVLHQWVAYSHAVIDGRSVHKYEPGGQAAAEITNLYNHMARLYGKTDGKLRQHEQTTRNTWSNRRICRS
jgi:cellulose biosynthesis protein BcsQ